ncbi:MAG: Hsp70 family protein [Chitinivibrionales bacterium]
MAEPIVGIDLGTTNSEISCVVNGQVKVLPVHGKSLMPSCVGLDPGGRLIVGQAAKNQLVSAPESTIVSIKRLMGNDTTVSLGDRQFSPEEISAMILAELKREAQKQLGTPVSKAVVTVPAFFGDHQRQATMEAGKLAGLDVVRIINEPTAAAIAYEADHADNQRMLVYDLGGGTFDVSLVVVENGIVEVKASHGDTNLGGDDFDNLLIDHVFESIREKHQVDLSEDIRIRRRIWKAAEKAKRELSDHPFARIREEFITSDIHVDMEISREHYEEMITPLLDRTVECVNQCLRDGSCLPGAVDRILLVGGSTRTPLIHVLLEKRFGRTPHHEINPDLIVSMGAAAHGAVIGGEPGRSILVDITPHTFGTSVYHEDENGPTTDRFIPVIRRNTPLPVSKSESFYTMHDGQEEVEVNIYQGEELLASKNTFIGKFMVKGLSDVPAGNMILLNLELDLNGIMKVTATEKSTGLSKSVVMDTNNPGMHRQDRHHRDGIGEILHGDFTELDEKNSENDQVDETLDAAKKLKVRAGKLLETSINQEDAQELRELLEKSREAIAAGDSQTLTDLNASLEDLIFYLED